jgi:hypothetical protein
VHMSLTAMSWRQKRKAFPPLSSAFCFFQHFTQETENRDATVGFPSFSRSRKVPQLFEKKRQKSQRERRMIGARARNRDGWMGRSPSTVSTCACTNSWPTRFWLKNSPRSICLRVLC